MYIFRFLHQTTTFVPCEQTLFGCISFVSYIKPQPSFKLSIAMTCCISFVSYIKPQRFVASWLAPLVVYLSFPTSNHNHQTQVHRALLLYIFRFLHQTTTLRPNFNAKLRCISFVSYIKPQPRTRTTARIMVVYLSFPTSNHNYLEEFE